MSLERIFLEGKENLMEDKLFYSLVGIMINDYLRIKEKYPNLIPYPVGTEVTTDLHGAILALDPSEEDMEFCGKIFDLDEPINISDPEWIKKLEEELSTDGGRIVKDGSLVKKASFYAHLYLKWFENKDITDLITEYTVSPAKYAGERVTSALAFSLATKKHTYVLFQTIQRSSGDVEIEGKRFSRIGTGKVAEYGHQGLLRVAKLNDEIKLVPQQHLLDNRVFIQQRNYALKGGSISLVRSGYVSYSELRSFLDSLSRTKQ